MLFVVNGVAQPVEQSTDEMLRTKIPFETLPLIKVYGERM